MSKRKHKLPKCKQCHREFSDDYSGMIRYCRDCHNDLLDDPVRSKLPENFGDTMFVRSMRRMNIIHMHNGDSVFVTRFYDRKGLLQHVDSSKVTKEPSEAEKKYIK